MIWPPDRQGSAPAFRRLEAHQLAELAATGESARLGATYAAHLLQLRDSLVSIVGEQQTPLAALEPEVREWWAEGDEDRDKTAQPPDWLVETATYNERTVSALSKGWQALLRAWFRHVYEVFGTEYPVFIEPEFLRSLWAWSVFARPPDHLLELVPGMRELATEISATVEHTGEFIRDLEWEQDRLWDAIAQRFVQGVDWEAAERELADRDFG